MHEVDATYLIKTVFDFFLAREFEGRPTEDEYQLSLLCFQEFVRDQEPYWVRVKAQFIISRILTFKDVIGDCPATIKEAVLAIVKEARKNLEEAIADEIKDTGSSTLSRDINYPQILRLNGWNHLDWSRSHNRQSLRNNEED
jgi:hypothetical protein